MCTGMRLDYLSFVVLSLVALFAVFKRDWFSPGMVGMSLLYSTQLTGSVHHALVSGASR